VGFFSRRRKKESAIPQSSETALGSFAKAEGQPVVGQQVGGGMPGGANVQGLDLGDAFAMLSQVGPMIQQAMASGNVQITQGEPTVINARGTELGEQIKGIMAQHGIDPDTGQVNNQGDANTYMEMQQQILQVLAQHGIDANAPGSINVTNVEIEGQGELPGESS
jgi:hypothetical protein